MTTRPHWTTDDEDLTLTVPLRAYGPGDLDVTDVILHPSFRVEAITEDLPAPCYAEPSVTPQAVGRLESFPSGPSAPFSSAPNLSRPHSDISRQFPRVRLDSDVTVSTWKKTVPALRRLMGLPVFPGWRPTPLPRPNPLLPMPPAASPSRLSPLVSISMALCLVAMVLIAIVGLGSRAAEASRHAHTRVVSASAPDGSAVTTGIVFVDGSSECEGTPCELELTPGVHWITVRAPGFETPPSRSINAGENEPTDVIFALARSAVVRAPVVAVAPAPVRVQPLALAAVSAAVAPVPEVPAAAAAEAPRAAIVRTAPLGARLNVNSIPVSNVLVDGRPVGQTPVLGLKVKPGAHSVVFISPDGRRVVRSTVVGAGRTANVAARL